MPHGAAKLTRFTAIAETILRGGEHGLHLSYSRHFFLLLLVCEECYVERDQAILRFDYRFEVGCLLIVDVVNVVF
jgi:hypothetical protein